MPLRPGHPTRETLTYHRYRLKQTKSVRNHLAWLWCAWNDARVSRYWRIELTKTPASSRFVLSRVCRSKTNGRRKTDVNLAKMLVESTA